MLLLFNKTNKCSCVHSQKSVCVSDGLLNDNSVPFDVDGDQQQQQQIQNKIGWCKVVLWSTSMCTSTQIHHSVPLKMKHIVSTNAIAPTSPLAPPRIVTWTLGISLSLSLSLSPFHWWKRMVHFEWLNTSKHHITHTHTHTHTKGTSQLTGSMNNNVASLFLYLYLFLSSLISLFAPLLMFGGLIGWLAIIRRWMNQTKHWTLYTNKPTI